MLLAIADNETTALDVAERGMKGLIRRTHGVHLGTSRCSARTPPTPRSGRYAGSCPTSTTRSGRAGSPEQIRDRFAEILDAGRTDHIVLQIPTGDMTFDEAKRTMDLFCSDVKPELEAAA